MDPSVLPSTQEEVGQATLVGPWRGLVGSEFSGSSCDLKQIGPWTEKPGREGPTLGSARTPSSWDHGPRGYTRSEGLPRSLPERPLCAESMQVSGGRASLHVFPGRLLGARCHWRGLFLLLRRPVVLENQSSSLSREEPT